MVIGECSLKAVQVFDSPPPLLPLSLNSPSLILFIEEIPSRNGSCTLTNHPHSWSSTLMFCTSQRVMRALQYPALLFCLSIFNVLFPIVFLLYLAFTFLFLFNYLLISSRWILFAQRSVVLLTTRSRSVLLAPFPPPQSHTPILHYIFSAITPFSTVHYQYPLYPCIVFFFPSPFVFIFYKAMLLPVSLSFVLTVSRSSRTWKSLMAVGEYQKGTCRRKGGKGWES